MKEFDAETLDKSLRRIVTLHISSASVLSFFQIPDLISSLHDGVLIFSVVGAPRLVHQVTQIIGDDAAVRWQQLRHSMLGGLTNARVTIGIYTKGPWFKMNPTRYPKRPLDRFLDPAVRLTEWRPLSASDDCWRPTSENATPYPWPWRTAPRWVETPTVFLKTKIERQLTPKECCQLFDLKPEWIDILPIYLEWCSGEAPPLRLLVEFVVMAKQVLMGRERKEKKGNTGNSQIGKDWGRERAPWVGNRTGGLHVQVERILYFGWIWDPDDLAEISVAVKGDDAEVNLSLWAVGGSETHQEEARGIIRTFLWKCWIRNLRREICAFLANIDPHSEEHQRNKHAARDCLTRAAESSWWNWDAGSRLFFWRWPSIWRSEARDGAPGYHFKQPRPQLKFPQVPITEEWIVIKDREKLEKLLRRKYIVPGFCKTTVPRFPVPKGTDDIRVVWDLAKNGVNETMYTPTFFLATKPTYLRRIEAGTYGGDFDIGEQFHNYILHESEQQYCGVEIPPDLEYQLTKEGLEVHRIMRWERLVFGWQSSPYLALRMFARVIELAKGPPDDKRSAFAWERIVLNLPGSENYDPGKSRILKISYAGDLAADIVTFYDDGRVFGPTEMKAHNALRQITARLQFFGNQDAARKRRPVSQRPGAWAGGVAYTDHNVLRTFITPPKWDRVREFLDWVWECLQTSKLLERQRFRSGKGFLVHVSMVYEFMLPYMKGFHLSEDAWRANRDSEGWKDDNWDNNTHETSIHDDVFENDLLRPPDPQAPAMVTPVPRLKEDVRILRKFFNPPSPVQVIARPVEGTTLIVYGGGDASGEGYGGQLYPFGDDPTLRRGFWCPTAATESSNWRELRNLIDTIKEEVLLGRLVGKEVWMATDNSTAASAFYRGTSSSKKLHDMVTELRMLTIEGNFVLHLYHVAGTRMIASGIDGLSRGELHIAALEKATITLMPLHLSPLQRSPSLKQWLSTWINQDFKITQPEDWFYNAHQSSALDIDARPEVWVWDLAPAAAIHALEELGLARLKRHGLLTGIVIIPSLLTTEWFRRFSKTVDIYFVIPPGAIPEWDQSMYESLTIGFYLPLFRCEPWDWKRVPFVVSLGRSLSTMFKTRDPSVGDILRKFWQSSTGVTHMPKRMVRSLLQSSSWRRFLGVQAKR